MNSFVFYVNELSDNKDYGKTTDPNSVNRNMKLLGDQFSLNLEINGMVGVKKSIATVIPIGRYVTIVLFDSAVKRGIMTFINHKSQISFVEIKKILIEEYGEDITKEWIRVYDLMKDNFQLNHDNVELVLPDSLNN